MSKVVREILERVAWMTWEEKTQLFRALCEYVGEEQLVAELASLDAARRARIQICDGSVVSFDFGGHTFSFLVENRHDAIQREHYNGRFYDLPGLQIMEKFLKRGATLLDVGANVGNHAIYAASLLNPSRVIPVEPNPPAIRLLRHNVNLNGLSGGFDFRYLGVGLASCKGLAGATTPLDNLGGTFLSPDNAGTIRLERGDALLEGEEINFIKIDVERMELEVLAGLEQTIGRCRPPIFIEVDDGNLERFSQTLEYLKYRIVERHKLHPENENFMIIPRV